MTKAPESRPDTGRAQLQGFVLASRGNVALIVALVLGVLVFGVGMGVDYTLANRRQDQINGFADAAALAAVTPDMMSQSTANAQAAAQAMFASQMATVSSVNYLPSNISITAVDTPTATTVVRTITISYTASSTNAFAAVLGMPSIAIGGSSSAKSSVAPRINFYMLLDTSDRKSVV